MKPIRIAPGALGDGRPDRELILSPQHRVALSQAKPERLVAVKTLFDRPGISNRSSCRVARYYHLVMDRHELVLANGTWAETMLVTGYSRRAAGLKGRWPERPHAPARPIDRGRDARTVIAASLGASATIDTLSAG